MQLLTVLHLPVLCWRRKLHFPAVPRQGYEICLKETLNVLNLANTSNYLQKLRNGVSGKLSYPSAATASRSGYLFSSHAGF